MAERILIYGAWSIGIFLWSKLLDAGHEKVVLYGRDKLKRIHDTILINDDLYKVPEKKFAREYQDYDIIFVTTKLYDTQQAIRDIQKFHPHFRYIAFIQNGLVEDWFYLGLDEHPGFTALSIFEGYRVIENQLFVKDNFDMWWQVGTCGAGSFFASFLGDAGVHIKSTDTIDVSRAMKIIGNSSVNALSALYKKTFGELVTNPIWKSRVDALMKESYLVVSQRMELPSYESMVETLYTVFADISGHYSSMYQDVQAKKPTEIEFLNGLIIKRWKLYNIPVPAHQNLYDAFMQQITY